MKNRSNVKKRDKEEKRIRRRRRLRGIALIGLFLLGVAGAYRAYPFVAKTGRDLLIPFSPVTEVLVEGNRRLSEDEVAQMLKPALRYGMFGVGTVDLARTLEKSPWIRTAEVRKEWPRRIRIRILEREPVALLEKTGRLYYLDAEGRMIEELRSGSVPFLPLVSGRAYPVPDTVVDLVGVIGEMDVMSRCESLEILVREGKGLVMNIDGVSVRLGQGEYSRKLQRWFSIQPEIMKRKVEVDHVDLRYSNKVIVSPLTRKGEHG